MNKHQMHCICLILAISATVLTGCHSPPSHKNAGKAPITRQESAPELGSKQVADLQIAFAESLQKQGKYKEALKAFQRALERDPKRADIYPHLAILYDRHGMYEKSKLLYRQALRADPNNPDLLSNYGYSLYLQGDWENAETQLRKALGADPKHRRAHNNLGMILARLGRPKQALAEFHAAGCSKADAHVNLAFACMLENQFESAKSNYLLAIKSAPSFSAARKGLRQAEKLIAAAKSPVAESVPAEGEVQAAEFLSNEVTSDLPIHRNPTLDEHNIESQNP